MTKFQFCLYLSLLWVIITTKISSAQEKEKIIWNNPEKAAFRVAHNQIWAGDEIKSFYDRLPARAELLVRKEVWDLSQNAAGLKLVFNTNAEKIIVRYTTSKDKSNYAMSHFPATGVSGLDLFAEEKGGSWAWVNGNYSFQDTIQYTYSFTVDKQKYKHGRKFHLYLPLYTNVNWLEIGIPAGNNFEFVPVSIQKPIIVYGTSIAQGGCASRPGMAWTNILNKNLHLPVVNLGFSGNGRLEKEVLDLIIENDAAVFILDCLPNMAGKMQDVKPKITHAVNSIRANYPKTPIVLVDHSHYLEGATNTWTVKAIAELNNISNSTFKELKAKKITHLYYLKHDDIGLNMNDSVDGLHPTDAGMLKYARAYEKLIRKILD